MMLTSVSVDRLYRYLFWSALGVITFLALWPMQDTGVTTGWDKSNHVLAFLVLAWLLDGAWPRHLSLVWKLALLLGYGLAIEVVQGLLAYRELSLWDWFSDGLGLLAYGLLRPWLQSLHSAPARLPFVHAGMRDQERGP